MWNVKFIKISQVTTNTTCCTDARRGNGHAVIRNRWLFYGGLNYDCTNLIINWFPHCSSFGRIYSRLQSLTRCNTKPGLHFYSGNTWLCDIKFYISLKSQFIPEMIYQHYNSWISLAFKKWFNFLILYLITVQNWSNTMNIQSSTVDIDALVL